VTVQQLTALFEVPVAKMLRALLVHLRLDGYTESAVVPADVVELVALEFERLVRLVSRDDDPDA